MNNKIESGPDGMAVMSWDLSEDISTSIWWSINTPYSTQFNNPDFGLDMSGITNTTEKKRVLFKNRIEKAVKWLLDIGKAKKITVIVEKDLKNIYKFNYKIDAIQADGIPISVIGFQTVGGPSSGFVFP